jgi:hypothetical protein
MWAALVIIHTLFYGLERLRYPDVVPPGWPDAILGVALTPCVVGGCYLTLRAWRNANAVNAVAVAVVTALVVGVLAGPSYGLGALLSRGEVGFREWLAAIQAPGPRTWYLWLSVIVEFGALYLSCIAAVVGLLSFRTLMHERLTRLNAEAMAARNRLRALRAQLTPHFLFNALNGIASLNDTQPAAAQQLVIQLSDLLRRTLAASEREEHRLADELQYIETYLQIQQVRLPSRLRWRIRADPHCRVARVPSLILLPLVENAVVHGLRGGVHLVKIDIEVTCRLGYLTMIVTNTCHSSPTVQGAHQGVGLRNVRERLNVSYGTEASLVTQLMTASRFQAVVMLPAGYCLAPMHASLESPCES